MTSCSFSRASFTVPLPQVLRNATHVAHAGFSQLLLVCDGKLFAINCTKFAGNKQVTIQNRDVVPVTVVCPTAVDAVATVDGTSAGAVALADARGRIFTGQLDETSSSLQVTLNRVDGVDNSAVSGAAPSVTSVAVSKTEQQVSFFICNGNIHASNSPTYSRPASPPGADDERFALVAVVSTTDGTIYASDKSGQIFRCTLCNDTWSFNLALKRNQRASDGVDQAAQTAGVANGGTCIGSGENDVVFCERWSAGGGSALRHIASGLALVKGLRFVADLVEVTGVQSQMVTPQTALALYQSAGEYIAEFESFSQRCRNKVSGSTSVGSLSDQCRKVVKLNIRAFERLSASPSSGAFNLVYCSESVVETFFSLVTYFGGRGVMRLNQTEFGRAFALAARWWLLLHPCFGNAIAGDDTGVRANRRYRSTTRAPVEWFNRITLNLRTRGQERTQVRQSLDKRTINERRNMATTMRKIMGILRTLRVRAATCGWFAEGFACNMSRLKPSTLPVIDEDEEELDVEQPQAHAAGAEMLVADAEMPAMGSAAGGAAAAMQDDIRQGDDVCLLPPSNSPDPFWIGRVAGAQGHLVHIHYYEKTGDDDDTFYFDVARPAYHVSAGAILSRADVLMHEAATEQQPLFHLSETEHMRLCQLVVQKRQIVTATRKSARSAANNIAEADQSQRLEEGHSAPDRSEAAARRASRAARRRSSSAVAQSDGGNSTHA